MAPRAAVFWACVGALCACGNTKTDSCLDTWERRTSTLAPCAPTNTCAQLSAQPEIQASFVIDLAGDPSVRGPDGSFVVVPEGQRLANWNCMAGALRERGVSSVAPYQSSSNVAVTGTWSQIQDVRGFRLVLGIAVTCPDCR
ncbi:MAG: hypothetical protein SF187_29995 [Deltaproteobacteria bacterium]|nr:hypothetical protein [Deltaproteobacteria bacterium]